MQRLDSHAVADEKDLMSAPVPEREGEHAIEFFKATDTFFFVEMKDDFAVGRRAKPVAPGFEGIDMVFVIVDLAVKGEPDGLVLISR